MPEPRRIKATYYDHAYPRRTDWGQVAFITMAGIAAAITIFVLAVLFLTAF